MNGHKTPSTPNTSFTDGRYLQLTGGSLTGALAVPSLLLSGSAGISGNANLTGTLAGALTVGSIGTPIKEHISILVNPSFPALKGSTCASANFALGGAADGDTMALGVPNERMSANASMIYTAWVSAANTVTVQACDIMGTQRTAGAGAIRVDLWKH